VTALPKELSFLPFFSLALIQDQSSSHDVVLDQDHSSPTGTIRLSQLSLTCRASPPSPGQVFLRLLLVLSSLSVLSHKGNVTLPCLEEPQSLGAPQRDIAGQAPEPIFATLPPLQILLLQLLPWPPPWPFLLPPLPYLPHWPEGLGPPWQHLLLG